MRRAIALAALVTAATLAGAAPAPAGHDHYLATPSGGCRLIAHGQTAISDPGHGGYHRFHENVHLGLAADGTVMDSPVRVGKGECP